MSLTATAKLTSKPTAEGQSKKTALRVESKPPANQTADVEEATAGKTREASPYTHNFGVVPLYPGRQPFVQPKLTVNKPGDKYEQEADSMADKVMRMAEPSAGEVLTGNIGDVVQRKCDACEDEDKDKTPVMRKEEGAVEDLEEQAVMRKEESAADTDAADGGEEGDVMRKEEDSADTDEDDGGDDGEVMRKEEESADTDEDDGGDGEVMRKEEDTNTNAKNDEGDEEKVMREVGKSAAEPQAAVSWQSSLNSSKSGGAPLPAGTKTFMESAFQTDFSSVRVHTDSRAAEMSKGIQARAFTHGSDIYFNTGQFTPENAEGKRLLAHELTHVLQQQNGISTSLLQRKTSNGGVGTGTGAPVLSAPVMPAPAAPAAAPGNAGAVSAQPAAKQTPGGAPAGGGKSAPAEKGKEVKPVEKDKDKPAEAPKADTSSTSAYLASLQHQQPTDFISSMKSADTDVNQIHGKEKDDLQKDMPVIDQPTGLPTLEKTIANRAAMELAAQKRAAKAKKDGAGVAKADTPVIKIPEKPIVKTPPALTQPQVDDRGVFEKALSNSIASLPTTDDSIRTSLGPRPKPDLTGDANPDEITQETTEQEAVVTEQQTSADLLTKQDFGEDNIYPDLKPGKLKPENKLTPPARVKGEAVAPPEVTPEVAAAFNTGAMSKMQVETAAQVQKNDEAAAKMQEDKDKEKKDKMQEIDKQTELVKQKQQKEQASAKKEVTAQRVNWAAENEKITKDYNDSAKKEGDSKSGEINTKVKKANDDVEAKYKENEDKIAEEKAKADAKAADKKKEAEQKQESGGFFSAIGDFLSDVWDSIKDAVNFIFDELRKAVKFIIEKVKQAVDAIIDAVRDLVVGLIKAFGEALKAFVSIALAAFPDLAKKINGLIDKAVDYSVDAVNKWADDLKKAVNALLDALGAALDFILSLYQKAFNLLIDALKFLTVGLMKILQGLANLVTSASQAPDHFWSQVSVEVIGQDITNPLPNEIGYDKSKDETQIGNGFETLEYGKKALGIEDKKEAGAEQQEALTADDVVNNEVVENLHLDPALAEQLQSKGDGETEFGETPGNETALDDARADASQADAAKAEAMKGADSGTIDAAKGAAEQVVDNAGKVGPFKNAWERGQYVLGQIKTAISKWWGENSGKVIAGLIAGLLAGIVLEVVTGGAVTAAIPVIMELLATLFAAQDIADGIVFLGTYVVSAWQGQIAKGAMALARTFVKLIMAFIFDLIGGGEMIKGIKGGIKAAEEGGAKGLMQFGKSAAKNFAAKEVKNIAKLSTIAKDGAKAAMENGKLVISGVKNAFKDGAKSLEELSGGLLKKFRFKKFKIEVRKFRFYFYGEVNPWVLLATGDLVEVKNKAGGIVGKEGKFMSKEGKEVEGILVGIGGTTADGMKMAKRLEKLTKEQAADLFTKIHSIYEARAEARLAAGKTLTAAELKAEELAIQKEARKIIQERMAFDPVEFAKKYGQAAADAKGGRDKLGRSLKEASPGKSFEAHHIAPVELIERNAAVRKAIEGGFEFNADGNGQWVKRFSSRVDELKDGIHASHPSYTNRVEARIMALVEKGGGTIESLTKERAAEILRQVTADVKQIIKDNPGVKLDELKI